MLAHRECYLSCCSISRSPPWREKIERPRQKIKCFWRRRWKGRRPACSLYSPLTLWVGNRPLLLSCIHPKLGLAGELRADGRRGMHLYINAHVTNTASVFFRLCEADVNSCSVVGLSQSGCVCVWELGHRVAPRMVWAPESEGWQLARWGGGGTLVTGHHNGDVTLHCSSTSQTSLCHLFKDSWSLLLKSFCQCMNVYMKILLQTRDTF